MGGYSVYVRVIDPEVFENAGDNDIKFWPVKFHQIQFVRIPFVSN